MQILRLLTYRLSGRSDAKLALPRDPIRCTRLDLKKSYMARVVTGGGSSEFVGSFDFHEYFVGVTSATLIVPFRLLDIRSDTLTDLE